MALLLPQWRVRACSSEAPSSGKASTFWRWLSKNGAPGESTLVSIGDSVHGSGLFVKKSVAKGQQLVSIPQSLWMDSKAVKASSIGEVCRDLKPLARIALFLLYEKSKPDSHWAAYIDILPPKLDSPLFWTREELEEIKGTQLLASVLGYREFLRREFSKVETLINSRPDLFDPGQFTLEDFIWAFGILRSRTFPPLVGDNLALVPLADLINHSDGVSNEQPSWECVSTGLFSKQRALAVRAAANYKENEEIFMQYGSKKSNATLALDYGFVESHGSTSRNKFTLTLEISPTDRFIDDKLDIAELNGLAGSAYFDLVENQEPPETMLAFLRLIALSGQDAFLLEALFRNSVWEHLCLPVSRDNEEAICEAVIAGCRATLGEYSSTIEEDDGLLSEAKLSQRMKIAVVVRRGEKRVLRDLLCSFEARMSSLDKLEYYAERRLRDLGLADDKGNLTPWVFDP